MLDESIPLTTGEFEEWGNPQDPQYYEYMKSYSPYDNVTAQAYPHLLVTTGLHDSQVQYWEPAKWVAKLRELKTDDHLLLLCTDMDSGHGGKSGRFKSYEGVAMEYAFLVALAQGTLPATPSYDLKRPDLPPWPESMSVQSNKRWSSVFSSRNLATHFAGSQYCT